MKSHRLTDEELKQIQEEHAKKEAQESQLRKERSKKMMEEMKRRELDELTPKARSALAARWEEQIKSRTGGGKITTSQNKTTVMSDVSMVYSLTLEKTVMILVDHAVTIAVFVPWVALNMYVRMISSGSAD